MKVCVLNGSPKGRESVTMQYVRFLELAFPGHTFVTEEIGQKIRAIEEKEAEFSRVIASVASADFVIVATPVYFMLVPAQLKRFIEMVFSRNGARAFVGKPCAVITTSIHFFDHTAHAYLHAIAEDLGMRYTGSFSAKMDDLISVMHQKQLVVFFDDVLDTAGRNAPVQRSYLPVVSDAALYHPGPAPVPFDPNGRRVVILADAAPGSNLERMVTRLSACFGKAATVLTVEDTGMKGGCLGCCRCAFENTCVYDDGFSSFWKGHVLSADIIIFAGMVKDRYLSSAFKQVFDRSFFMGHVPGMAGKQCAYLLEGPLAQLATLHEVLAAYVAVQGANLAGIVTDEGGDSGSLDARIDALADRCLRLSVTGYIAPAMFPAVAGKKLFRDEIFSDMRVVFRADDRYYRQHGVYDFPTRQYGQRIRTAVIAFFLDLPPIRRDAAKTLKEHMIAPLEKAIRESPVLANMKGK